MAPVARWTISGMLTGILSLSCGTHVRYIFSCVFCAAPLATKCLEQAESGWLIAGIAGFTAI